MIDHPIFFERNRVARVYTGGKLFADFFGDEAVDSHLPEEWVASSVRALNKESAGPNEGISKPVDSSLYFHELLDSQKEVLLGKNRDEMGFLVKILDSAVRLPVQAHPDTAFSNVHFHSNYGKAESWIILATRPDAKIYMGFKDSVTKDDFRAAIAASETDKTAMEGLLREVAVKPGDVFFIPAKMVHAIGAGCLLLEVQEPTDFTIQPERYCADYRLSDYEMYLGLDPEVSLACFDFNAPVRGAQMPLLLQKAEGVLYEELIGAKDTPCFNVNRMVFDGGKLPLLQGASVLVVTEGEGILSSESTAKPVKKGDYFFLPDSVKGKFFLSGNLTVLECFKQN